MSLMGRVIQSMPLEQHMMGIFPMEDTQVLGIQYSTMETRTRGSSKMASFQDPANTPTSMQERLMKACGLKD